MKTTISCWPLGGGEYLITSPDGSKEMLQVKVVKRLVEATAKATSATTPAKK